MIRLVFIMMGGLILTGCETTPVSQLSYTEQKTLANKMIDRCIAQGIAANSPELKTCAMSELDREIATRESNQVRMNNARIGLANGMQAMGNSMQQSGASYSPPVARNCTVTPQSTFVGGTPSSYSTSCY